MTKLYATNNQQQYADMFQDYYSAFTDLEDKPTRSSKIYTEYKDKWKLMRKNSRGSVKRNRNSSAKPELTVVFEHKPDATVVKNIISPEKDIKTKINTLGNIMHNNVKDIKTKIVTLEKDIKTIINILENITCNNKITKCTECQEKGKKFSVNFNHGQIKILCYNCISVPPEYKCPVSALLMKDPVIISSGKTYERESIEKWITTSTDPSCPMLYLIGYRRHIFFMYILGFL